MIQHLRLSGQGAPHVMVEHIHKQAAQAQRVRVVSVTMSLSRAEGAVEGDLWIEFARQDEVVAKSFRVPYMILPLEIGQRIELLFHDSTLIVGFQYDMRLVGSSPAAERRIVAEYQFTVMPCGM